MCWHTYVALLKYIPEPIKSLHIVAATTSTTYKSNVWVTCSSASRDIFLREIPVLLISNLLLYVESTWCGVLYYLSSTLSTSAIIFCWYILFFVGLRENCPAFWPGRSDCIVSQAGLSLKNWGQGNNELCLGFWYLWLTCWAW